jgi:DNA (cytosine-5)-methyltransferase 1
MPVEAPSISGCFLLINQYASRCWIQVNLVSNFWHPIVQPEPFRLAELACGAIAGFTQAALQLGFSILECSDVDPEVVSLVAANLPHVVVKQRDVKQRGSWHELQQASVLAAGFPCQPWSNAGLQKGLNDPRELLQHLLELLFFLRTPIMVLENVIGFSRKLMLFRISRPSLVRRVTPGTKKF